MPTTYTDQFYTFDPANPPAAGTPVSFSLLDMVDNNDDGDIDRFNTDTVNGSDVTASYPGDTVTIFVTGVGNVTYTGITFYLQDGGRVFTPTDGQVLQDGVFVGSTFVNGQGPLDVDDLGPPCFVTGTRLACPGGARPVEHLTVGALVQTRDHGAQPVRWIGSRAVQGVRAMAPVRIAAGVLGNARDLLVSQQHRMLIEGWRAEMFFGAPEVLVAAKSLLGHDGVHLLPCRTVTYWHIMFDAHEIVDAEGAPAESFDPGGMFARGDCETRQELEELFPEMMGRPAVPTTRPVMRTRDACALFA